MKVPVLQRIASRCGSRPGHALSYTSTGRGSYHRATLVPRGSQILVNTATASIQDNPHITVLANGGFVVTWQDFSDNHGC